LRTIGYVADEEGPYHGMPVTVDADNGLVTFLSGTIVEDGTEIVLRNGNRIILRNGPVTQLDRRTYTHLVADEAVKEPEPPSEPEPVIIRLSPTTGQRRILRKPKA
jgi:hypothetical protein